MGQTLTATVNPNGATATYKWKKADTESGSYADITEATASAYVLSSDENGKYIKVEATGTGKYSGTVLSAATVSVAPAE